MIPRRELLLCLASVLAAPAALATTADESDLVEWRGELKGCLCPGCGRKLEGALEQVPGVRDASMDVKSGALVVVSTRETRQQDIVDVISRTKFTIVRLSDATPRRSPAR